MSDSIVMKCKKCGEPWPGPKPGCPVCDFDDYNRTGEWDSLPKEEKLGRNVIYFMKKWGETQKDNAIYRQDNAELEEENKSLRASIKDLQEVLEFYALPSINYDSARSPAGKAIDRLKASGNYVESEK